MNNAMDDIWLAMVIGAVLTYACRFAGLVLAGKVNRQSLAYRWLEACAYGLLAALIARMLVLPLGPAAAVLLEWRLAAVVAGFAAFLLLRRSVLAATLVATGTLMGLLVLG